MGSVRRDLNGILMPVMMLLRQKRRDCGLLNEALGCSTAEIDDSTDTSVGHNVHHVENVLDDIEHEIILFLEAGAGDTDGKAAIGDSRTENRHARLVSRSEHTVFRSNFRQLPAEEMQKLAG